MKEDKKIFDNWRVFLNEGARLLPLDDWDANDPDTPDILGKPNMGAPGGYLNYDETGEIDPVTGEPWIRFDSMDPYKYKELDVDDLHPLDREEYWQTKIEEAESATGREREFIDMDYMDQLKSNLYFAKKAGERWLEKNPSDLSILDTASFGPLLDPRYKEQRLYYTPTEFTESLTRNLNESSMPGYFIEETIEEELEKIFHEVKSKVGHTPTKKRIKIKGKNKNIT